MSAPTLKDVPRDLRGTVADALKRGWVLDRRKGAGHMRLVHPQHRAVPVASSRCSEALASKKLASQIRRVERGQ